MQCMTLLSIEHNVILICRWIINKFWILQPRSNDVSKFNLEHEFNYDVNQLRMLVSDELPILLSEWRHIFDLVIYKIENNEVTVIFIHAPGGSEKTDLINLLLAYQQLNWQIAIGFTWNSCHKSKWRLYTSFSFKIAIELNTRWTNYVQYIKKY